MRIEKLDRQRKRLLRPHQLGEIDDEYLRQESATLQAQRRPLAPERAWVMKRGLGELPMILDALQIEVHVAADGQLARAALRHQACGTT